MQTEKGYRWRDDHQAGLGWLAVVWGSGSVCAGRPGECAYAPQKTPRRWNGWAFFSWLRDLDSNQERRIQSPLFYR